MIEVKRSQFLADPVFHELYELLKEKHVVASHTEKRLRENKHIKNFCVVSRHFVEMAGGHPIYAHYDTHNWWKEPNGYQLVIESIVVYDNYMEWESARLRELHSAEDAEIPNIN